MTRAPISAGESVRPASPIDGRQPALCQADAPGVTGELGQGAPARSWPSSTPLSAAGASPWGLSRHVQESRYFPILTADHVTRAVQRMFPRPGSWQLRVERNLAEPGEWPRDLSQLDRGGDIRQRDIRIVADHGDEGWRTILCARSWILLSSLPEGARRGLEEGRETIGAIVRSRLAPGSFACENLWYRELGSGELGPIFEVDQLLDAVQRCRVIRLAGRAAILIHELIPVHPRPNRR